MRKAAAANTRRVSRITIGHATFVVVSVERKVPVLTQLTAAERAVLDGVLAGLTDAQIARRRGVATRTVSTQVGSLLRKLGASSRIDLGARVFAPR